MELSDEVRNFDEYCSAAVLAAWSNRIEELEATEVRWRELRDINKDLETENQRLRAKIADWQDRFTEGLLYDEDNNQTVLVWTQREIDQAKSEADEICKAIGIPLEVKDENI